MALSNSGNDYAGDTVLTTAVCRFGGIGEVIPDGPGKGNLVMIGEGIWRLAKADTIWIFNGNTETMNGLYFLAWFRRQPERSFADFY